MDDQPDLQNKIGKTKIVRTVIWKEDSNPGTDCESKSAKVVKFHTSSTSSNGVQNQRSAPEIVSFDRKELDQILRVYGFRVADGQWKDYAIDMLKDRAVFSVFRRAHDTPLHCIEKIPGLARKQGMYCVTGSDGRILKRGHSLATVLTALEKKPKLRVV